MGEAVKPVFLYHSTTSGRNNSLLTQLRKDGTVVAPEGLRPSGVQDNGFFMTNNRLNEQRHAKDLKGEQPGKPMVVVIALPERGLQYDFEELRGLELMQAFKAELEAIKPGQVSVGSHRRIDKVEIGDAFDGGMRVSLTGPGGVSTVIHPFVNNPLGDSKRMASLSGDEIRALIAPSSVGRPFLLQALRNHLAETLGDAFLQKEHTLVVKAIHDANAEGGEAKVAVKYTGKEPLPIADILVLDRNKWQSKAPPKQAL